MIGFHRRCRVPLALAAGLLLAGPPAASQDPQLVSRADPSMITETAGGANATVSADGRFVVFSSAGANLLAGQVDETAAYDVFLRDRLTGETTLVTHAAGEPLAAVGGASRICASGEYVVVTSRSARLVQGQVDTEGSYDVFLWERATDTMRLVSHLPGRPTVAPEHAHSFTRGVSDDGRYVLFESTATDLVPGQIDANDDEPSKEDLFLWDRLTDTTVLVSHAAGSPARTGSAPTSSAQMTPDGAYVVFESSAEDLVPGQQDAYGSWDVFLWERATDTMRLVSHAAGSSLDGGADALMPSMSLDGRFVTFVSSSTDLVSGQLDRNGNHYDVFLYDRVTEAVTLASHRPGQPAVTANQRSIYPAVSADGSWVAFTSRATDLDGGAQDDNGEDDVYLFERATGALSLVSRQAGTTRAGNGGCGDVAASPDGRRLHFRSASNNLVPGQVDPGHGGELHWDAFLYDVPTGTMRLVSHRPSAPLVAGSIHYWTPDFSADGATIVFGAYTRELLSGIPAGQGSLGDVFAYDVATEAVSAVSLRHPDLPSLVGGGRLFGAYYEPERDRPGAVSEDGRLVVFTSWEDDLVPGLSQVGLYRNVFLADRQTGAIRLVSHRAGDPTAVGNHQSFGPAISGDGRFVTFVSLAEDLVPGLVYPGEIRFSKTAVFLFEVATGEITLVSRAAGSTTEVASESSTAPALSADGRFVAFTSMGRNLVAGQIDPAPYEGTADVFLYDRLSGLTTLVSHRHDAPLRAVSTCLDIYSCGVSPLVSRDGAWVVYEEAADNLVASQDDLNGGADVFLYERASGTNRLVSRSARSATQAGNGRVAGLTALSGNARYVAFSSTATDHVPGQQDVNGRQTDVFVYDRLAGSTLLASRTPGSSTRTGNAASFAPVLDGNGSTVAFWSRATDLAPGLAGPPGQQVFVFEPPTGRTSLISHRPGFPLQRADGLSQQVRLSADGRRVAYESTALDLVPGQDDTGPGTWNVFVYDRAAAVTTLASHVPGQPARAGNRESGLAHLSVDGTSLYFHSRASDLTPGDYNRLPELELNSRRAEGWDVFLLRLNGVPLAFAQAVALREDTSRAIALTGSDADGDALTYALASAPQHGAVTGTPPNVTYTPGANYHGPDSFTFTVSDGRDTSLPATIAITVQPDSALAAADVAVVEGHTGTTSLIFTVTAGPAPAGPLTVSYQTVDGTAVAGSDYAATSGTLAFAAGQTSRTVAVTVNGDTALEENETFTLRLNNAVGGDVEDASAVGRITDDDDAGCTRPPSAEIQALPLLCLNRAGAASVPDAGAAATYVWTLANGTITGGAGTARITFGADAPGPMHLAVTVTNASGCAASGSIDLDAAPACHSFFPLYPCRLLDTRTADGPSGGPALEANTVRAFPIAGICGVPADAVAVAVNVTAARQTAPGNFRLFASGTEAPLASVLNFVPGLTRAANAVVSLGADGAVSVQCDMAPGSDGRTDLVLDVYGYFR